MSDPNPPDGQGEQEKCRSGGQGQKAQGKRLAPAADDRGRIIADQEHWHEKGEEIAQRSWNILHGTAGDLIACIGEDIDPVQGLDGKKGDSRGEDEHPGVGQKASGQGQEQDDPVQELQNHPHLCKTPEDGADSADHPGNPVNMEDACCHLEDQGSGS